MDADDFEPMDNVGPRDSTPGQSGITEASNNTYLRPSVPQTPWFRVIDTRRERLLPRRPLRRHQPHSANASTDMEPAGPACHAFP
ncbi:hypothetical protein MRX96_021994 [Rhipicephalus microplus]